MKVGDMIEWNGANKFHRGQVIQAADGELVCQMENGCIFPLDCLRYSKSAKLIET